MEAYNRLSILALLKSSFSGISDKMFLTDRPTSTTSQSDSFSVIKIGDMENLNAYGSSYVTIRAFAKDTDDGLERTNILSNMEQSIYSILPLNNTLFYTCNPKSMESKSDGNGFHYLTIFFDIILK